MMFGTTVLIYMVMLMIWETNFFLATAFLISFGFIDMVYTTGKDMTVQWLSAQCDACWLTAYAYAQPAMLSLQCA